MIRFAVVGTNWVTERFIDAAHESGKLTLSAVYSRRIEQARITIILTRFSII